MQNNTNTPESTTCKPERSPIITVLFFFGIVMNIVLAIMTTADHYFYYAIEPEFFIVGVCQNILNIASFVLLLYWRVFGFYLYIINVLAVYAATVMLTGTENALFGVIQPIISIAILYAILQIKEGGIPYWKALKMKR